MPQFTNDSRTFSVLTLENAIESFERGWFPGKCDQIQSILESYSLGGDLDALTEIVRTDIELSYANGQEFEFRDYLKKFETLQAETQCLCDVAYEDFRSRVSFGYSVDPARWQELPGIEQEDWFELLKGIHPQADEVTGPDKSVEPESFGVPIASESESVDRLPVDGSLALALADSGFRIVQRIGRGTFGDVFLATQDDLANRFVVLKIVRRSLSEPLRLARLQHANIVPIYSCHQLCGYTVLCMPYWGRLTLADYLDCVKPSLRSGESLVATVLNELSDTVQGPGSADDVPDPSGESELSAKREPSAKLESRVSVDIETSLAPSGQQAVLGELALLSGSGLAVTLYGKLAEALAHSHARGILHCDIKPHNVLIRRDGEPALFDFNLAHSTVPANAESIGGTPAYLSPEACQALMSEGSLPTASWDIYSLGVMMYQFITGRLPYAAPATKAPLDMEVAIASRRQPLVWSEEDELSAGMRAILTKSLAFEADNRYRDVEQLCEDLGHEANGRSLVYASEPMTSRIRKWIVRHPQLITSLGIAFLLLGVVLPVTLTAVQARSRSAQLHSKAAFDFFSQRSDESLAQLIVSPERVSRVQDSDAWKLLDEAQLSEPEHLRSLLGEGMFDDETSDARREVLYRHVAQLGLLQAESILRDQRREIGSSDQVTSARGNVASTRGNAVQIRETKGFDELMDLADRLSPNDQTPSLLYLKSQHTAIHGDSETAERLAEAALALEATSPNELYLKAVHHLTKRRWRMASDLLAGLADKNAVEPALRWTFLGRTQYLSGDYERAKLSFTQSIEHHSTSAQLHQMLGLCHYKLREYRRASVAFSRTRELDPTSVFAWQNGALSELSLGNGESAMQILNEGLDQLPNNVPLLLLRSRVGRRRGNTSQAEHDFIQAMQATDLNAQQLVSRAKARRESDLDGAILDLRTALQLDGDDVSAMQELASVLVAKEALPEAIEILEQLLVSFPENEKAAADQAVLLARISRHEEADEKIEFALEEPNAPVVLYQAACVHALDTRKKTKRVAVSFLARAMRAGFDLRRSGQDPDLRSLYSLPGFRAIQQTLNLVQPTSTRRPSGNQPVSRASSQPFFESLAGFTQLESH